MTFYLDIFWNYDRISILKNIENNIGLTPKPPSLYTPLLVFIYAIGLFTNPYLKTLSGDSATLSHTQLTYLWGFYEVRSIKNIELLHQ